MLECGARLGFVVVQPAFHFSFQFLTLLMSSLIKLGSVSAIKGDLIDRPEEKNCQEEQRKGPHGAHLKWIELLPAQ